MGEEHLEASEQEVAYDQKLFAFLQMKVLHGELDFVHYGEFEDLIEDKEYLFSRIFYYTTLGKLELEEAPKSYQEIVELCEKNNLDQDMLFSYVEEFNDQSGEVYYNFELDIHNFYEHFLAVKINAAGLLYIDELKKKLAEKSYFYKAKQVLKKISEGKMMVGMIATGVIILGGMINPNIVTFAQKIPLVASLIDTDMVEVFVDVDESDEYYQVLKDSLQRSNALPVQQMRVKHGEEGEKIFQVTFENGKKKEIPVRRDQNGRYLISK